MKHSQFKIKMPNGVYHVSAVSRTQAEFAAKQLYNSGMEPDERENKLEIDAKLARTQFHAK